MERLPFAVNWLSFEDEASINLVIRVMRDLRIGELRTAFSWADWERPGGEAWFDYFVKRFTDANIRLVPCLFYTPTDKARTKPGDEPKTSYPPKRLEDYADFVGEVIGRYGRSFEWIHLWNEANWNVYWNWDMDPGWKLFAEMIRYAIPVCKRAEKKIVLGGMSPYETMWVDAMFRENVLQHADALGIHAFPGTWDKETEHRRGGRVWKGLVAEIEDARAHLRANGSRAEIWLTETGYSTFGEGLEMRDREKKQVAYFDELMRSPADRAFWHSVIDQRTGTPTDNELNSEEMRDDKAYHFGIVRENGNPKALYYYWQQLGIA
jgi:CDP-paratose 2-epimerase